MNKLHINRLLGNIGVEEELSLLSPIAINSINWKDFPYCPRVNFQIAYDSAHLYVRFEVEEEHLRAVYLNDNESVWEDSCVELFVQNEGDTHYYNFEINAIGTILASRRLSRTEAEHFDNEQMSRIIRISSLAHQPIDRKNNSEVWRLLLGVPFDIIGCDRVPDELLVNLYKCGDMTQNPHFLSWSPIATSTPDFHRPEFFGKLVFDKN